VRKGIIEVQGHISVRHDRHPNRYFLPRGILPEIVNTAGIMGFDRDSHAIDPKKGQPYLGRFIHGEIFKARPEIMSVVHAHTRSVLPFATSDIPLRPVYQLATFLVDTVPVFKNGDNGEVIRNAQQGATLTQALGKRGAILLHGHGFVVAGASIQQAVARCIQLDINAQVLHEILAMGGTGVSEAVAGCGRWARWKRPWAESLDARGERSLGNCRVESSPRDRAAALPLMRLAQGQEPKAKGYTSEARKSAAGRHLTPSSTKSRVPSRTT